MSSKQPPPPEPFTDDDIKDKFWRPEPFDDILPHKGWITDLIYTTRGIETPTSFSLWAAIWTVGSALRRDAWHQFPLLPRLYPNMYVILAGPPRILGKSTILGICSGLLRDSVKMIDDEYWRARKKPNLVHSRVTGEALIANRLDPSFNPGYTDTKTKAFVALPPSSQACIYASDLPTFLGKQKYNESLINQLIDLYDCKDYDEITTIARGTQELHHIFVTLIGAATYEQLAKSLPEQAFGDGFLSRCVVVARAQPTRIFPVPRPVEGAPNEKQLAARLCWLTMNGRGAFDMDAKALARFKDLYETERYSVMRHLDSKDNSLRFRYDVNLRKLAMILRASRYEVGRTITIEDLEDANAILQRTLDTSVDPLIAVGGGSPYQVVKRKLEHRIRVNGQYTRLRVLRGLTRDDIDAKGINNVLTDLLEEEKITVWRPDEPGGRFKKRNSVSRSVHEVYRWGANGFDLSQEITIEKPTDPES